MTLPPSIAFSDDLLTVAKSLDPESLSEHMRRDLGLSGGRIAPPRDIFRD